MINRLKHFLEKDGFSLLNSNENIKFQEEMRKLEASLLNDDKLEEEFITYIDEYENSMLRNICSYCQNNPFNTAIFMCGAAHRKSIIEKIRTKKEQESLNIKWTILGE